MIKELGALRIPDWLRQLTAEAIQRDGFPLQDILNDSVYYPSSGIDGDPIKYLAGNTFSFVYVDHGKSRQEMRKALNDGFRGYSILLSRDVEEKELTPNGWEPDLPQAADGNPRECEDFRKSPFAIWAVMERQDDYCGDHGPKRFSLLYVCADGVAGYQAIYKSNGAAAKYLAIIQPGHAFGGNWTDYEDPDLIFARTVLGNPAGTPDVLLYGGIGKKAHYKNACWPNYAHHICFLQKDGGGTIGVWQANKGKDI